MFMAIGSLLNASYILTQFCEVGSTVVANLHMRKLRHRELECQCRQSGSQVCALNHYSVEPLT